MANANNLDFELMRQRMAKEAEDDIIKFVELIRPELYLADIHKQILRMCAYTKDAYLLVMIPRGHLKSQMFAILTAYFITIEPDVTILYCSENDAVTQGQLRSIKNMLISPAYKLYWPDMVEESPAKRAKWTKTEFTVDHPKRKDNLSVRECTVTGKTVGQSFTGAHYDIAMLDDLVTKDNAYTESGRTKVSDFFGALMAIVSGGARVLMAGTPYHPRDLYTEIEDMGYEDDDGDYKKLFKIRKEVVEKDGVFLWPRKVMSDGKAYGFDKKELSIKKSTTKNPLHFFSQYYMNPQALDGNRIGYNNFKYFNPEEISFSYGRTFYKDKELSVTAAMDFAFSLRKTADSTVIVVTGMDVDKNVYVLDIIKFKTNKIKKMYGELIKAHRDWGFKKVRCETVAAQEAVVEQFIDHIKDMNVKKLKVIKYKPNRHDGTKEERMAAQLEPVYQAERIYHNKDHKFNSYMEEEIVSINPPHDDVKNALADSLMDLRPPMKNRRVEENNFDNDNFDSPSSMFGGYN